MRTAMQTSFIFIQLYKCEHFIARFQSFSEFGLYIVLVPRWCHSLSLSHRIFARVVCFCLLSWPRNVVVYLNKSKTMRSQHTQYAITTINKKIRNELKAHQINRLSVLIFLDFFIVFCVHFDVTTMMEEIVFIVFFYSHSFIFSVVGRF